MGPQFLRPQLPTAGETDQKMGIFRVRHSVKQREWQQTDRKGVCVGGGWGGTKETGNERSYRTPSQS